MASWLSMDQACRTLSVRPQTIYAYVSRGKLEAMPDPGDPRRSLYRPEDVNRLAKRKQEGRKHETLATNTLFGSEPSIPTALSTFMRGHLYYCGRDAVELSKSFTLEDVASLLWGTAHPVVFSHGHDLGLEKHGRASALSVLANLAAVGHSTHGRQMLVLQEEASDLVSRTASAFCARRVEDLPMHMRFAKAWGQTTPVAELLRAAMVLLADHELTSSAFSARIASSTGASLPACLLAGLTTLSGPLHGDASGRVHALFDEVLRLGEERVIDRYLSAALPLAGFGHHLYPDGDPRASALLALFEPTKRISRFIQRVTDLTGLKPNIDIAISALATKYKLPADASFCLFATSRSVGLLAHILEQLSVGQVIRPRGRYVGQELSFDSSGASTSVHRLQPFRSGLTPSAAY
jgi:citrate synthase